MRGLRSMWLTPAKPWNHFASFANWLLSPTKNLHEKSNHFRARPRQARHYSRWSQRCFSATDAIWKTLARAYSRPNSPAYSSPPFRTRSKSDELSGRLREKLDPMGLSVLLCEVDAAGVWEAPPSEPFVITTMGPDRPGLVAGITELLARFGVNISKFKSGFQGWRQSPRKHDDIRSRHSPRSGPEPFPRSAL